MFLTRGTVLLFKDKWVQKMTSQFRQRGSTLLYILPKCLLRIFVQKYKEKDFKRSNRKKSLFKGTVVIDRMFICFSKAARAMSFSYLHLWIL